MTTINPPRETNGEFRAYAHGDPGTYNDTMGGPALVTFPINEIIAGVARRVSTDPETWARKCPQCRTIFVVEGDYRDVGTLTSQISVHVTQAHSTYEEDARLAGEVDPALVFPANPADLGSYDNPIDVTDKRVQSGEVFDTVRAADGQVWHRNRPGVYADESYGIRLQADRKLTADETRQASQLMGYLYRSTIRGEHLTDPRRDSQFSFSVGADLTKSSRDDIGDGLAEFEGGFDDIMRDGSPMRTTDRAGAGTKGTRLIEGFGPKAPKFEIYYDSVFVESRP